MMVNTNKMFNKKFIHMFFNDKNFSLNKYKFLFYKITFSKINITKNLTLISEIAGTNIYFNSRNNKYLLYIKPYSFYTYMLKQFDSFNIKQYNYSYYNIIFQMVSYRLFKILKMSIHATLHDLIKRPMIKIPYSLQYLLRDIEHTFVYNNIVQNYFRKDNKFIYRDFGGVQNFLHNGLRKRYAFSKKFSYQMARYSRIKYTGYKGVFTAQELYREIISETNIITLYSFIKFLHKIQEPVIYDSINNTKKFYFYTIKHKQKAVEKFLEKAKEIEKKVDEITKDTTGFKLGHTLSELYEETVIRRRRWRIT